MGANNPPVKNQAWTTRVMLSDATIPINLKANPTIAAGDFKIDKDGGGFNNLATLPTVDPAASVGVKIVLSGTEMNADIVTITGIDQTNPKEWADFGLTILTT